MSFVVVDFDGCLVNDVSESFNKFLRSSNSKIENAYKEAVFTIIDNIPFAFSNAAKKIDFKKMLNQEVIKGLKELQEKGMEIIVRTANINLKETDIKDIEEELKKEGLKVKIERAKNNEKCKPENGEKPSLIIDDNPKVILNAIKNGINSIIILTDYNRVQANILSKLSNYVSISKIDDIGKNLENYKSIVSIKNRNLSTS